MKLAKDLREFIELLNSNNVEYLIVGAFALAFHARPRFTGDLDIWIRPGTENASRILRALESFGFPTGEIDSDDFTRPGSVIQLGFAPVRIDILTTIDGVIFEDAYPRRANGILDSVPVSVISREDFLVNKRSTGRPQDLADAAILENA